MDVVRRLPPLQHFYDTLWHGDLREIITIGPSITQVLQQHFGGSAKAWANHTLQWQDAR
jgi:hypothetical protein